MMINVEKTAAVLVTNLKKLGFDVSESGSNLSESMYLVVSSEELDVSYKFRISNHELPPSYAGRSGGSDYEVGCPVYGVHWAVAVRSICERHGLSLTPAVKGALTRLAKAAAAKAEKDAEIAARRQAYVQRQADRDALVNDILERKGKSGLTGKQRKRARQSALKELRAAGKIQ